MTVVVILELLASFAAGGLLGLVVFGGLWLTIRGLDRARHPALRMVASLLLRLSLVLGVFYFVVAYGSWEHVLAVALGFTALRFVVVRRLRPAEKELGA